MPSAKQGSSASKAAFHRKVTDRRSSSPTLHGSFDVTRGHVLLAGPKTIASVPDFARADRELVVVRSSMDPEDMLKRFAGRVVFIGGGPPVWDAYARFVRAQNDRGLLPATGAIPEVLRNRCGGLHLDTDDPTASILDHDADLVLILGPVV